MTEKSNAQRMAELINQMQQPITFEMLCPPKNTQLPIGWTARRIHQPINK